MACTNVPPALLPSHITLLGTSFGNLSNAFKNYHMNSSNVYLCDFFASETHKFSGKLKDASLNFKKK